MQSPVAARIKGKVMPKLLWFSERRGCGATFEMDDKKIVIVSVAQSGVLVKAYKGKFSCCLFPLFGAVLYNEKIINVVSKTSIALDRVTRQSDHP